MSTALQNVMAYAIRYNRSLMQAEKEREKLYEAIRAARAAGATWGQLKEASGLSRERVRQVAG